MADSLTPITSNQLSKVTTAKDTDLVTLGINGDFVVMTLANLKEVLGINALNTNPIGADQMAYVTFNSYGDYWWISSPIPCSRADQLNITLSDNVKNTTTSINSAISQTLFEIRKCKNQFYVLTNDQAVAGYIFREVHPGVVWEVHYNVYI